MEDRERSSDRGRGRRRSPSYSRYDPDHACADHAHSRSRSRSHSRHRHTERQRSRSHSRGGKAHRSPEKREHRREASRSDPKSRVTEDRFDQKLAKLREETTRRKNERKPDSDKRPQEPKQYKINNSMLSFMIRDNIRTNVKMDQVRTAR